MLHVFTHLAIDRADLLHPTPTIGVLQLQDFLQGPVEVVGNEGYLLLELFQGVAYDSPDAATSTSTSNSVAHDGHVAGMRLWPFSLMRR